MKQVGQYGDEDEVERDSNDTSIARGEILINVLDGLEEDLPLALKLDRLQLVHL